MNIDTIPWNYTDEVESEPLAMYPGILATTSFTSTPLHLHESDANARLSPGVTTPKQSSQNKYYFKIRNYSADKYLYHGPLYLHGDGTYRSNNSREANMMYQKGLLDRKTKMYPRLWNSPFATLPVITHPTDLTPVDKFYRLIVIQPNPEKKYTASVSYKYLKKGKILYFRWDNSDRSGRFVAGGSVDSGIIEAIDEDTWIKEQTKSNYQPAFNLAYHKLVSQRNLAKHVNKLIKTRDKRIQLKALCKSISKWTIRNINTLRIDDIKIGRTPSIIRATSFFGPGANNVRYRISSFL
jgi:hypothetical protein